MQKNKNVLYFKHKQDSNIFSSEIFDNGGTISIRDSTVINAKPEDILSYKTYTDINAILNDDSFVIFTDNSFTKSELKMIEDVIYAHGRHVYGDERVITLIHKIEKMFMDNCYLPQDETKIIRK
jgi:hypothetical protein